MRFLGNLGLALILGAAGCSQIPAGKVCVVDATGKPVQGARVGAVSPSMNTAVNITDSHGEASVPIDLGLQRTVWVNIEKSGYATTQVDIPAHWPLRITLTPAASTQP